MSAGLEVRGNSMRIWWRFDGERYRETLDWPLTPQNQQKAEALAKVIELEIGMGTFDIARHFPDSVHIENNTMNFYSTQWLNEVKKEVAPSTWDAYHSQVKTHIRPKWGKIHPKDLKNKDVKRWISHLKEKLHSKTVREVFSRLRQIHAVWRQENQIAFDPTEGISISQVDSPEPDPFTKAEIAAIFEAEADPDMVNILPCIMWTGLSLSEQLPLAWEDVDLVKGTVRISRSYVRGIYRVTKNRRRKREIKLLEPALEALKKQYERTGCAKRQAVSVLQRDNHSYTQQKLRFVWLSDDTGTHFEYHTLRHRWNKHLRRAKVRLRGANQGRHTFASQLLTSGQVPPEWIADQLGHANTDMIYKHYGKLISEDAPDYASRINQYIKG